MGSTHRLLFWNMAWSRQALFPTKLRESHTHIYTQMLLFFLANRHLGVGRMKLYGIQTPRGL